MAVKFRQVGFKLYDQLINGSDFSQNLDKYKSNLAGFVGGRYKAVIDFVFSVSWSNNNETPLKIDLLSNWLSYSGANWVNEGFNVGDQITGKTLISGANASFTCFITSIDGDRIYFSGFSSLTGVVTGEYTGFKSIYLQTQPNAINYSFGFVENSDNFSNNSLLTGSSQTYYGVGGNISEQVSLTQKGAVKDWVSGVCNFSYEGGETLFDIYDGVQHQVGLNYKYQISHEFILNPFYEEGDISNLTNEWGNTTALFSWRF